YSPRPVTIGPLGTKEFEIALINQKGIEEFVNEISTKGKSLGETWYCNPIDWTTSADIERNLKDRVRGNISSYVQDWLKKQREVREAESSRRSVRAASPSATHPNEESLYPRYLGLQPYGRKDAPFFFGRTLQTADCLEVIADPKMQTLMIKGASGVGKS